MPTITTPLISDSYYVVDPSIPSFSNDLVIKNRPYLGDLCSNLWNDPLYEFGHMYDVGAGVGYIDAFQGTVFRNFNSNCKGGWQFQISSNIYTHPQAALYAASNLSNIYGGKTILSVTCNVVASSVPVVAPIVAASNMYIKQSPVVYTGAEFLLAPDTPISKIEFPTNFNITVDTNLFPNSQNIIYLNSEYYTTASLSPIELTVPIANQKVYYRDILDVPAGFSGKWTDIIGKPTWANLAYTGSWNDITGKPSFATVATSGNYFDLSNRPDFSTYIPSWLDQSVVLIDGTLPFNGTWDRLFSKPALKTVATTGSYNDLTDKPTIPTVPTLATVATSGSYNDLSNKPTIPTLPTLATVATSGSYYDLINRPSVNTNAYTQSGIYTFTLLAGTYTAGQRLNFYSTVTFQTAYINEPAVQLTADDINASLFGGFFDIAALYSWGKAVPGTAPTQWSKLNGFSFAIFLTTVAPGVTFTKSYDFKIQWTAFGPIA